MAPPEMLAEWLDGNVTIAEILLEPNKELLRSFKEHALEVLKTVSGSDIRDACLRGAPQYADIWYSPAALGRFEGEVAIMYNFIREL